MNSDVPTKGTGEDGASAGWVATFTVLDVSGVITASQWRRLVAPLKTLWRRTMGR